MDLEEGSSQLVCHNVEDIGLSGCCAGGVSSGAGGGGPGGVWESVEIRRHDDVRRLSWLYIRACEAAGRVEVVYGYAGSGVEEVEKFDSGKAKKKNGDIYMDR